MAIAARCECGRAYLLNDDRAGQVFRCTLCGQHFVVPARLHRYAFPPEVTAAAKFASAAFAVGAVLLYVYACSLPALDAPDGSAGHCCAPGRNPHGINSGLAAALFGWCSEFIIPWSANIVLVVAIAALSAGRFVRAALIGAVGVALGLSTSYFFKVYDHPHAVLLTGYYVWMAALAVPAVGGVVCQALCKQPEFHPDPAPEPKPLLQPTPPRPAAFEPPTS